MANLIRRTFAALGRHLRLDGSPGPLVLGDLVVPVAVLHQHLEDDPVFLGLSVVNASTALNTAALDEGSYRIAYTMSYYPSVTTSNASQLSVLRGGTLLPMAEILTDAASFSIAGSVLVAIKQGDMIQALAGGSGVGNRASVRAVIQKL